MLVLASLVLDFSMLDALHGLDLVRLHPTPMRACSDVTIWKTSLDARLLCAYPSLSTLRDAMLIMFVCATRWLSMHLYMLAYMSMHESCLLVCRPCVNTMKLWTFDPNLHLSRMDTTFCLSSRLFVFSLVCLLSCALLSMSIVLICFMPPSYALCIFSFHCLFAGFLSLPLHLHTWNEDAWS